MAGLQPHVVVVGAGIAGLAAALRLRRDGPAGLRITVLESSGAIGGKVRTGEIAGAAVEQGAESFLARRPEGVALARAVGLGDELVGPGTTTASLWTRGRLRPLPTGTVLGVPGDLRALARSRVLGSAGLARVVLDRARPDRRDASRNGADRGADIAVGRFVAAKLGREVVDRLVDPLLGGVYAGRADTLSLAATVPQLLPAWHADGSLGRAAAAARTAGAGTGPVFAALPGGLHRLTAAVAARSGAEVRLHSAVRELTPLPGGGWRLVVGPTRAPEVLEADAVVLAVPAAPAARLLNGSVPAAAAELAGMEYASVALVTLAYPSGPGAGGSAHPSGPGAGGSAHPGSPGAAGSGFLVPAVDGRLIKAATFFSAKWPHVAAAAPGLMVVRASVGRYGETAVLQRDDADLVRGVAAELAAAAGLAAAPVRSAVTRWGGALPQYAVGHLDRVARIRAAVGRVPGLAVCGAAYDGVGIPACIGSGQRAAASVLSGLPAAPADRAIAQEQAGG